jgi:tight adherence protein C
MLDQIISLLTPQIVVTLLAAIAAFATTLTVLMPVLSRDRLSSRMQVMATERENIREMRESAVAILAHLGMGPVKRTEQQVLHRLDTITDPVVLARIISTGEIPPELDAPSPSRH